MTTELAITLLVGLIGGGGIWEFIESRLEKRSGLKKLREEMHTGFEATSKDIKSLRGDFEESKALAARIRILRFSDEVTKGELHSEESFRQVLHDIDDYDKYCDGHPDFKNSRTVVAARRVKDIYAERLEKDDFL